MKIEITEKQKNNFSTKFKIVESGCWEWLLSKDDYGYGRFLQLKAHRVSYCIHNNLSEIPDGYEVCHSCDNPACVRPDHLWLGTHSDNMQDMIAKGRRVEPPHIKCGEGHFLHTLSDADIEKIRSLKGKMTHKEIAKIFDISRSYTCCILNNHVRVKT
jgi:hypothetical protein